MDPAPPRVRTLPLVGRKTLIVNIPTPSYGLVNSPGHSQSSRQRPGIGHQPSVGTNSHGAHSQVNAYGRSVPYRGRYPTVLNAEAGKPGPSRPVDSHRANRATKAEVPHHCHPAHLRQVTTLPSTRTVPGPLVARKPCSRLRRLKRGNPPVCRRACQHSACAVNRLSLPRPLRSRTPCTWPRSARSSPRRKYALDGVSPRPEHPLRVPLPHLPYLEPGNSLNSRSKFVGRVASRAGCREISKGPPREPFVALLCFRSSQLG